MHAICICILSGLQWPNKYPTYRLFAPVDLVQPLIFKDSSSAADITVEDKAYQTVKGFGASLTDSGAQSLSQLKQKNPTAYSELLKKLFDPSFNASSAGITYLRVPLGASDFSHTSYSYDDAPGDTALKNFNIDIAPPYVFEVLNDIQDINNILKVHVVPWSPPGWMKDSNKVNGGNFKSDMATVYAQYLLKALQGFESKGNEPRNTNPSLPSCKMTYEQEGAIGVALKPLMKNNGFSAVKLIGFEHNWSLYQYPISLMKSHSDVFDGVAFHCYGGKVAFQDDFFKTFPNKDLYFTECTGMDGTDWWDDVLWQTEHLFQATIQHHSQTALMWQLISGEELPGSNSCYKGKKGNACRAVVTVNSDGTYKLNQEYYAIAHAARAVLPRDTGGSFGQLINSTVAPGPNTVNVTVNAYKTTRVNAQDPTMYSLHVLNYNMHKGPYTVKFQDKQLSYSFPVGVSTLHFTEV
ncbi:Glycoside hydrolase [Mycena venus]|uniref:Glycoside hydrolase n=1 Tax=Mycena venus TaxID=2733690 RepID=A0A8H6Y602_9AGAR|nr:Glycoside hydrolase [Mycena venus]